MNQNSATGAELIAAERTRQVEVEGWSPEHDRAHVGDGWSACTAPLVRAATAYLQQTAAWWPWDRSYFKPATSSAPADRIRELVKAGALIAAEIDRLAASGVSV